MTTINCSTSMNCATSRKTLSMTFSAPKITFPLHFSFFHFSTTKFTNIILQTPSQPLITNLKVPLFCPHMHHWIMTNVVNVATCEGSTWFFWTSNFIVVRFCYKPTTGCFCCVIDADCYYLILLVQHQECF